VKPNQQKQAAKESGGKRYLGGICVKHPELFGERLTSNGTCLGCNRAKMRARRAADPEYHRAYAKASYLKYREKYLKTSVVRARLRKTGIDDETYRRLLSVQGNKCGVCSRDLLADRPHADHCHETMQPRGILCATCNQAEGLIKRSGMSAAQFGEKLAEYLANPPARKLDQ
jgi:hypothetical protein